MHSYAFASTLIYPRRCACACITRGGKTSNQHAGPLSSDLMKNPSIFYLLLKRADWLAMNEFYRLHPQACMHAAWYVHGERAAKDPRREQLRSWRESADCAVSPLAPPQRARSSASCPDKFISPDACIELEYWWQTFSNVVPLCMQASGIRTLPLFRCAKWLGLAPAPTYAARIRRLMLCRENKLRRCWRCDSDRLHTDGVSLKCVRRVDGTKMKGETCYASRRGLRVKCEKKARRCERANSPSRGTRSINQLLILESPLVRRTTLNLHLNAPMLSQGLYRCVYGKLMRVEKQSGIQWEGCFNHP